MPIARGRFAYVARGGSIKQKVATGAATSGFIDSDDLAQPLERAKLRANAAFAAFRAGAREIWDDIIVSTATQAPPPPRDTYGVDTRGRSDIIRFRVWWDNFKGRASSADARFNREDRYPAFQEWFHSAISEVMRGTFS